MKKMFFNAVTSNTKAVGDGTVGQLIDWLEMYVKAPGRGSCSYEFTLSCHCRIPSCFYGLRLKFVRRSVVKQ